MRLTERIRAAARAWRLGEGVVSAHEAVWGVPTETYSPSEYGDYIASSGAVYTCATLRAQLLSSLPIRVLRWTGREYKEQQDGNLYNLLHAVNPHWTFGRLLNMTELSLCLWGSAFWTLERGESGTHVPQEIWWARSDRMTVVPSRSDYVQRFDFTAWWSKTISFAPGEVVWLRYPNPQDEFSGLSPLVAARLAADSNSAAMMSNKSIFDNGLRPGGFVFPPSDKPYWDKETMEAIEQVLEQKLKGTTKAHRLVVMKYAMQFQTPSISPKDAEFGNLLRWSLEEICRAYKVPLDLVGGQRTYENTQAAYRALWTDCIEPEARFIAEELTEQLVPLFGGEADRVEFDFSNIAALQEAKAEQWARAQGQIERGAITINEWRKSQGLERVPWGDVWWAASSLVPAGEGLGRATAEGVGRGVMREALRALKHRRWRIPRRISVSGVRDGNGNTKNKTERELAEDIAIILALLAAKVRENLGDPPDINNVPEAVWAEFERRLRDAIRPALERVAEAVLDDALEDAGLAEGSEEAIEILDELDAWARSHAAEEAAALIEATKRQAGEGIVRWSAQGEEGDVWDAIARWFEDARAGTIASDAVTDAALMAMLLLGKRAHMERVWHTMQDEAVCDLCAPLDGLRESEWPSEIQGRDFQGERLHPNCRCWVTLERVR